MVETVARFGWCVCGCVGVGGRRSGWVQGVGRWGLNMLPLILFPHLTLNISEEAVKRGDFV